jgi:hypothetical protein
MDKIKQHNERQAQMQVTPIKNNQISSKMNNPENRRPILKKKISQSQIILTIALYILIIIHL